MFHLFLLSLSGSSGDTLLTTSPCSILQLTECALIKLLPSPSSAGCGDSRDRCEIQREHLLSRVGAAVLPDEMQMEHFPSRVGAGWLA